MIRNSADGERELVNLTWGMPSPPTVTNGRPDYGVTNIRNLDSPHWRGWTGVNNRCIAPWTAFCEYEDTKPKKTARWFAIDGIWDCQRNIAEYLAPESGVTEHQLLQSLMNRLDGPQAKDALGDDWKGWWPDDDGGDDDGSPTPQDREMA